MRDLVAAAPEPERFSVREPAAVAAAKPKGLSCLDLRRSSLVAFGRTWTVCFLRCSEYLLGPRLPHLGGPGYDQSLVAV